MSSFRLTHFGLRIENNKKIKTGSTFIFFPDEKNASTRLKHSNTTSHKAEIMTAVRVENIWISIRWCECFTWYIENHIIWWLHANVFQSIVILDILLWYPDWDASVNSQQAISNLNDFIKIYNYMDSYITENNFCATLTKYLWKYLRSHDIFDPRE